MPQLKKKISNDVLQVVLSDMHSGSNNALFLDREWHGIKTSHIPRSAQVEIRKQFEIFADEVKKARQGKKIKLIHNGDAIDGNHHQSGDVCSLYENEQADIHIELMNEFQRRIDWQRGDEIYYVKGTETHVKVVEHEIGKQMNAVPCEDFFIWDFLPLETNGILSWFVHHGKTAGEGANEGNSVRNWMKIIQVEQMKNAQRAPDIIYTGHVHQPTYVSHSYKNPGSAFEYKTMHYIITPSWQKKTAYALQKVPLAKNRIGGVYHLIKADGTITIPKFCVMNTQ